MSTVLLISWALLAADAAPPPTAPAAEFPPSERVVGRYGLGMPISVVTTNLGPGDSRLDDKGAPFYGYHLGAKGTQLIFRTAPFRHDYIFGIQVSGKPHPAVPATLGILLGAPSSDIRARFGEPTRKDAVEGLPRRLWYYAGRNYSFEVDDSDRVVSIALDGYLGVMTGLGWPKNWERYQPDALAEVIQRNRPQEVPPETNAPKTHRMASIVPSGIAFRPRVTYTGEFQETTLVVRKQLSDWYKSSLQDETGSPIYSQSLKVLEGGTAYWVAVQDSLVDNMREELKPGDAMDLFAIYTGEAAVRQGDAFVYEAAVFVNEFCDCWWGDPALMTPGAAAGKP